MLTSYHNFYRNLHSYNGLWAILYKKVKEKEEHRERDTRAKVIWREDNTHVGRNNITGKIGEKLLI